MDKDPITGKPYPPDAIQRLLYVTPKVHVYRIPPITSTKGFAAASWTQNPADLIFSARLRIIETAIPPPSSAPDTAEKVFANVLLEDPSSGQLFAAAPYTNPAAVEQASDSSRFFAVRVVGEGGMKATLGVGFEERPEAFDFSVCLQDVRRSLGMETAGAGTSIAAGRRSAAGREAATAATSDIKRDFSLKEGETITVNIGGKSRAAKAKDEGGGGGLFSIPPPPGKGSATSGGGGMPFLPPPPSASQVRSSMETKRRSLAGVPSNQSAAYEAAPDSGFDDGEFGEFQ